VSDPARAKRRAAVQAFKRQGILDAAEAVFLEDGLDSATIRAIAKKAGCAAGTVYLHFQTKEDIYAALLGESLERLKNWIEQKVEAAQAGGAAEEALGAFYLYYAAYPRELDLGLYLFQGAQRRGLSKALDARLNGQLEDCLMPMMAFLQEARGWPAARARQAVLDLVSHMVGCLILENTGRLKALGGKGPDIIERRVAGLLAE